MPSHITRYSLCLEFPALPVICRFWLLPHTSVLVFHRSTHHDDGPAWWLRRTRRLRGTTPCVWVGGRLAHSLGPQLRVSRGSSHHSAGRGWSQLEARRGGAASPSHIPGHTELLWLRLRGWELRGFAHSPSLIPRGCPRFLAHGSPRPGCLPPTTASTRGETLRREGSWRPTGRSSRRPLTILAPSSSALCSEREASCAPSDTQGRGCAGCERQQVAPQGPPKGPSATILLQDSPPLRNLPRPPWGE